MPEYPSYVHTLAALRDGNRLARDRESRPLTLTVADDYGPARLVVESPARLARAFVKPFLQPVGELFALDGVVAVRPEGSTEAPRPVRPEAVVEHLFAALTSLPPLGATAGAPYRRLQRLASLDPAQCRAYLASALTALSRLLPAYAPKTASTSSTPATPAERKSSQRARDRADEDESTRAFLRFRFGDSGSEGRVTTSELYADAVDWLSDAIEDRHDAEELARRYAAEWRDYRSRMRARRIDTFSGPRPPLEEPSSEDPESWSEIAQDTGYPPRPRIPSRIRFFAVADDALNLPRIRSHGTTFYEITQESVMNLAKAVIERAVDKLADEVLDAYGPAVRAEIRSLLEAGHHGPALLLQREAFAATGTDGAAVIPFPALGNRR